MASSAPGPDRGISVGHKGQTTYALDISVRITTIINMRTTLTIADAIMQQAKKRAAERKVTLGELVEQALREALRPAAAPTRRYRVVTFGDPKRRVQLDPKKAAELLLDQEIESIR
jgi:hypothetical protein